MNNVWKWTCSVQFCANSAYAYLSVFSYFLRKYNCKKSFYLFKMNKKVFFFLEKKTGGKGGGGYHFKIKFRNFSFEKFGKVCSFNLSLFFFLLSIIFYFSILFERFQPLNSPTTIYKKTNRWYNSNCTSFTYVTSSFSLLKRDLK